MAVVWDDELQALFAADLTVALGYRTPAGGVVVQAVAPIGLHDRERRTPGFTTSLGFSKKLERLALDSRVSMASTPANTALELDAIRAGSGQHSGDRAAQRAGALSTGTRRNVDIYGRSGFRVVDEADAPGGGPHIWLMRRDPPEERH
jgi:hypothetical protein